jgi:hypothetical protein
MIIVIYVDDPLISGDPNQSSQMTWLQEHLARRFKMSNLGEIPHYLGMEVDSQPDQGQIVRQATYLRKIIRKFGFLDGKTASILMQPGLGNTLAKSENQAWYQSVIGSLVWAAMHTRPDISYSVGVMARFCSNPSEYHCQLVERIFRYLAGTITLGLTFRRDEILT